MKLEYGGTKSFSKYMWLKDQKTPLSYNEKYSAEIEQAKRKDNKHNGEDSRHSRPLFTNCHFYIDDFVSLLSIYDSFNKGHSRYAEDEGQMERESPYQRTTLHRGEGHKGGLHSEWNNFTNPAEDRTVDRYDNSLNSQAKCSTPYNSCHFGDNNNYVNSWSNDFERAQFTKLHDRPVEEEEEINLDRTPTKSTHYDSVESLEDKYTSRERSEFDTLMKSYERVSTPKRIVRASYINKKEEIEIMIIQNGGFIHNALTSKVTHIISNNMALGSKKYMDYKKGIKKSKVFIVEDRYIFDCVKFQCRFPEQSYLPSVLRNNCRQITEFFPLKGWRGRTSGQVRTAGKMPSLVASYLRAPKCISVSAHCEEGGDSILRSSSKNGVIGNDSFSVKTPRDRIPIDKHLLMLNMHMSYANVKKFIVCNSSEYFRRLRKIYLKKELKENAFPGVGPNLYINKNTFEEFSRKHKILSHLSEEEINWIKKKSHLNINVKNVWENDMVHFFFNIVLKRNSQQEVGSPTVAPVEGRADGEEQAERFDSKSEDVSNAGGESGGGGEESTRQSGRGEERVGRSGGGSENGHNHLSTEGYVAEKLIKPVYDYLHNSRLYILGNWNYLSREFFKFEDINEKDKRKFVYIYIDFDNYFLNATVNGACEQSGKNRKIGSHEILCVCHSLKKEDSYSVISSTNYWGRKNKIRKGMLKREVTKMHKQNIRFVKYDFSNILRCSYLFLLILMNYSKNVRVLSIDESILQLFYQTEEEIFLTAKKIADDIYNLTKLSVSIGISSNLSMSRKAVAFCKKRFLFLDYYHHFCIFIMGKYFLGGETKEETKGEINRKEHVNSITSEGNFEKERAMQECHLDSVRGDQKGAARNEQGDDLVREENYAAERHPPKKAPFSSAELKNLFDEYLASAVAASNQVNSTSESTTSESTTSELTTSELTTSHCTTSHCTASNLSDLYFLDAMKDKRNPQVDSIFNMFVQANRSNLEHITNTFFDRIIHPISRFFFFYKKNEHYLDVLRQLNYSNGQFVHFNIYYLPVDGRAPALAGDDLSEDTFIKLKRKDCDRIDGKKCATVSVNYGVRFQNINDFYFLIYYMAKQFYIRLRIRKLKAKDLDVYFSIRDEEEDVNLVKYLGQGKVNKFIRKIELSHYTDSFFVYFFKVIYQFDSLVSSLSDIRGVQMVCSDVVSVEAFHNLGIRSILSYFPVGGKGNMKEVQGATLEAAQGAKLDTVQGAKLEAAQGAKLDTVQGAKLEAARREKLDTVQGAKLEAARREKVEAVQGAKMEAARGIKLDPVQGDKLDTVQGAKLEAARGIKTVQGAKLEAARGIKLDPVQGDKLDTVQGAKLKAVQEAESIALNMRDAQVHRPWWENVKFPKKRATHVQRHNRCAPGKKSKHRKLLPLIDDRRGESTIWYFFNRKKEVKAEKKVHISSDKCVPFSFRSVARKKIRINNKHKNNGSVRRTKNHLLPSSCNTPMKAEITGNYKIYDFFPRILMKRKRQSSTGSSTGSSTQSSAQSSTTTRHNDHVKKWIDENVLTTDKNIFDSIINKRVKRETHIKEEFNCCYVSYRRILENVMEKQKGETIMRDNQHVCANESFNDNIFCHSDIILSLYAMNRESEEGVFYTYTKKIISSYISHFNNLFENHNCQNDATDKYYLLKFVAAVVDSLCEELHRRRLLDVLHKFLKNFKHVWCMSCGEEENGKGNEKGEMGEKRSFPLLFHRTMVKYGVD
ncbi:hypothetical protein C922_01541 [Plasmodium inui San Antonio 1]|uniref:DNA repair protein REV1 n=1 Tax=Plasmodium inui San Antonio 1 TaxID=1237626 RepID=W7AFW5_9APIC|nr:hypothetical protein C922_01541 [Plasmodium inui San Antonio 1]EUD67929.1 hypothetical protein C922_01541 [Plasmodium inui San Antonio 1]